MGMFGRQLSEGMFLEDSSLDRMPYIFPLVGQCKNSPATF